MGGYKKEEIHQIMWSESSISFAIPPSFRYVLLIVLDATCAYFLLVMGMSINGCISLLSDSNQR